MRMTSMIICTRDTVAGRLSRYLVVFMGHQRGRLKRTKKWQRSDDPPSLRHPTVTLHENTRPGVTLEDGNAETAPELPLAAPEQIGRAHV